MNWKKNIYDRFHEKGTPLFIFHGEVFPAAFLWVGIRKWVQAFRSSGLKPGDRLLISLDYSPAFIQVLLAGIWEKLTLCIVSEDDDLSLNLKALDPRAIVSNTKVERGFTPDNFGLPKQQQILPLSPKAPPQEEVRFILKTSGTTKSPKRVALSENNIASVLNSHTPLLNLQNSRMLSILPWAHIFGLVIELLPAIFHSDLIVRDAHNGKNLDAILPLFAKHKITHFSSVPSVLQKLSSFPIGKKTLRSLKGGVIGGAKVPKNLANFLKQTQLQAGYGLTEASPGIALGKPGYWHEHYLGQPVHCKVRIEPDGELSFLGKNICLGYWKNLQLERNNPDQYFKTNDIVKRVGNDLFYLHRKNLGFKLPNGKMLYTDLLESQVKQAISNIQEIYFKEEKNGIAVFYVLKNPNLPTRKLLMKFLRFIENFLSRILELRESDLVYTSKGQINKQATFALS